MDFGRKTANSDSEILFIYYEIVQKFTNTHTKAVLGMVEGWGIDPPTNGVPEHYRRKIFEN